MIKTIDQRFSNSKRLNDALAHLRPLSALTGEDKANSRSISALLPEGKCSFINVNVVCDYISSMEMATSSFRKRISEVRQLNSHTRVAQVFTNGLAIIFKGFCIVGGEDKSVGLGGFVFRKEQFPTRGYG